jgi:hypothetical protein
MSRRSNKRRNIEAWSIGAGVGWFAGRAVSYLPIAERASICSVVVCGYDITPLLVGGLVAFIVALVVWSKNG